MLWAIEKQRQRKAKWNAEQERQEAERVAEQTATLLGQILGIAQSEGLIGTEQNSEAWRQILEQNGVTLDGMPVSGPTT